MCVDNISGSLALNESGLGESMISCWKKLIFRILTVSFFLILIALVAAFEGYFYYLPFHPDNQPIAPWLLVAGPGLYLVLCGLAKTERFDAETAKITKTILYRSGLLKDRLIRISGILLAVIIFCLVLVTILWVPQFLIQPLWTDHEHVITMARHWDKGNYPWTAMRTYQFPGEMQIAWSAAKIGGWNNPVVFYAIDLILFLGAATILALWSKRIYGSWKYAVFSYMGLLAIEMSLPFTGTAQRDTHATLLCIMAFCMPVIFRKMEYGLCLNAILFGFALSVRPHSVLFLPLLACGYLLGISSDRDSIDMPLKKPFNWYDTLIWTFFVMLSGVLFFSPVIGINKTREFWEALQFPLSQAGDYRKLPFSNWENTYMDAYRIPRHFWFMVFTSLMVIWPGENKWRKQGLLLGIIFITGNVYRLIHPVDHGYLKTPLELLECIGLIIILAWIKSLTCKIHTLNLVALCGLAFHVSSTSTELYFEFSFFRPAMRRLITGHEPDYSPPGARAAYPLETGIYHYDWSDWVESKAWIELETSPETRILNLLSYQPFPPFCATTDRMPPGRLESIVLLNWFKKFNFQPEIINSLEQAPFGTIVIWEQRSMNPDNRRQLDQVSDFIYKTFQKRMQFGEIEFWEKIESWRTP